MKIRCENFADIAAITLVNDLAFKQPNEGKLVCSLRNLPEFKDTLSFLAEDDGHVIGHTLLTPIQIKNDSESYHSLALAPVAVIPSKQRQGVGSALIKHVINSAREQGYSSIIVLGDHKYYTRFGFKPASLWEIFCPFEVPDEAFMALELKAEGLSKVSGVVQYPSAFAKV